MAETVTTRERLARDLKEIRCLFLGGHDGFQKAADALIKAGYRREVDVIEACAKVCEDLTEDYVANRCDPEFGVCTRQVPNAERFAAAICARVTQKETNDE